MGPAKKYEESVAGASFCPSMTVIVCTRNRPELLAPCLASLRELDYGNFDIVVVDNSPADRRSEEVARRYNAKYIVEPRLGLSRARNAGAHFSQAEIVVYIDDDAVADAHWLSGLAPHFNDESVGIVTGAILPMTTDSDASALAGGIMAASSSRMIKTVERGAAGWFSAAAMGGFGDGGNMAFRRTCFERWNGFDERLGRGRVIDALEEHLAFVELVSMGFKMVFTPDAVVLHPCKPSIAELRERTLKDAAAAGAFMTLLLVEHPQFRIELLRFMMSKIKARLSGAAHQEAVLAQAGVVSKAELLRAWLSGLPLYWKGRKRS